MTTKITEQNISNLANAGVQWQTVVTADGSTVTTAVVGYGYFIDTTSAAHTVNLPNTANVGDTIILKDYAGTWGTNNVTISSTLKISGADADGTLSTNNTTITIVYMDTTKGWTPIQNSTQSALATDPTYVTATGGTITTSGDYKIHTFTGDGTFCVSAVGNPFGSSAVDYLVVAGGGGSGSDAGGGGGAGGLRFSNSTFTNSGPSSPRNGGTALPVTATGYPVTVGGGGAGTSPGNAGTPGTKGNDSIFAGSSTITSAGGGFGGGVVPGVVGGPGGSGGGGRSNEDPGGAGTGNSPPTNPAQGSNGGNTAAPPGRGGGGGGGFIAVGTDGSSGPGNGGPGGSGGGFPAAAFGPTNGQQNTGTGPAAPGTPDGFRYFAGGGHGGSVPGCLGATPACNGALGGGGAVKAYPNAGGAGLANTGGGGSGGTGNDTGGGAGGSGIVIIRYKFQ